MKSTPKASIDMANRKKIFEVYFPGVMMFAMFSFANDILKKLVFHFSYEILLFSILWVLLIFHITSAYTRGLRYIKTEKHTLVLLAGLFEIMCAIYMCSIMAGYENTVMPNYLHITVPFIGIVFSQFFWFILARIFDVPALFRLFVLFIGMLFISVFELISHNLWNLVVIIILLFFLVLLRQINKSPQFFYTFATHLFVLARKYGHFLHIS